MAQFELSRPEFGPAERNGKRLADADMAKFASNAALDTYLLTQGYTQATLDKLTQNDKVYAARQKLDATAVI